MIARRYIYKSYFPLSPRDFVALTTWEESPEQGYWIIATQSLPDDWYPISPSYVRGHVQMSCTLIKRLDAKSTELTMINHSHLSATVPIGIVNRVAVSVPGKFATILKNLLSS